MNLHSYERIDKGVKKGSQTAQKPHRRSPKADLGSWVIPEGLEAQIVLDRYLTESTTSQIAAEYGLSRKALVKWLRQANPEAWKQVQIIRAFCRKDDGDEEIEKACDALSLARAREMLKSGQWDLERLDHANYGQKQEVTVRDERVDLEPVLAQAASLILSRLGGLLTGSAQTYPQLGQVEPLDITPDVLPSDPVPTDEAVIPSESKP